MKIITALSVILTASGAFADSDRLIRLYTDGDLKMLRKELDTAESSPRKRLILALTRLNDQINPEPETGLRELKEIYHAENIPADIWRQAALTYGRTAQLMQRRPGLYGFAKGIDYPAVYREILEREHDSREGCRALVYLAEDDFFSGRPERIKQGFERITNYCRMFKGKPKQLVPVYLFTESQYIGLEKNYRKSAGYLEKAYNLGIESPWLREACLFRLGRMYDIKLHDKKSAEKYYRKFLENYPESSSTPAVKYYLKKLIK